MVNTQLNTSVTVKYKNGDTQTFQTIEEASEVTKLTVNSIKSRANKPGSGAKSKDGMTFQWADPAVRRSLTAKKSKKKGSSFELDIVHKLREIGYPNCMTSRNKDKTLDANKVDICDEEVPCYIQAKYTQNMPNYFTIRDACSLKDKPFVMCWKKTGKDGEQSPGTVAVIPIDYFYQLISKLK